MVAGGWAMAGGAGDARAEAEWAAGMAEVAMGLEVWVEAREEAMAAAAMVAEMEVEAAVRAVPALVAEVVGHRAVATAVVVLAAAMEAEAMVVEATAGCSGRRRSGESRPRSRRGLKSSAKCQCGQAGSL